MALDLYGRWVADDFDYDIAEAKRAARVRQAVDAHLAQHAPVRPEPVAPREVEPPPTAAPMAITQAVRSSSQPSDASHTPADPVVTLAASLEAAGSDAERAKLLASSPRDIRQQLNARLVYLTSMRTPFPDDAYDVFERSLAAATNDAERTALIAGRDATFLAEWAWRVKATQEDWRKRYLALVGGDAN
jgi:hypothetical protein